MVRVGRLNRKMALCVIGENTAMSPSFALGRRGATCALVPKTHVETMVEVEMD